MWSEWEITVTMLLLFHEGKEPNSLRRSTNISEMAEADKADVGFRTLFHQDSLWN